MITLLAELADALVCKSYRDISGNSEIFLIAFREPK